MFRVSVFLMIIFFILTFTFNGYAQIIWRDDVNRNYFDILNDRVDTLETRLNDKTYDIVVGCSLYDHGKPGFVPAPYASQMNFVFTGSGVYKPLSDLAILPKVVTFGCTFFRDSGQPYIRYNSGGTFIVSYFCMPLRAFKHISPFYFKVCATVSSPSPQPHMVELYNVKENSVITAIDVKDNTALNILSINFEFKTLSLSDLLLAIRVVLPKTNFKTTTIYFAYIEGWYNYD